MVFTKALALKLLGGLAVCTSVTVGGVKLLGGSKTEGKDKNNQSYSKVEQKQANQNDTQNNGKTERPSEETQNPTNQNTQDGSQRADGGTNEETQGGRNPQTQENPTGDRVNSVDPQPPQNLSEGAGSPPTQTSPQTQQVTTGANSGVVNAPKLDAGRTNTETTITVSNSELLLKESGLGLVCTADTSKADNGECTGIISGKTITVKGEGETAREGITSLDLTSGAKIKYEKKTVDAKANTYNKNLKITIEGGDITLQGGTESSQITKLEEFETYEVKEEGSGQDKKYYLSRKTKSFVGKSKALGLPNDCVLPEDGVEKECTLTKEQLNDLNFEGKGVKNSVHGSDESPKLKILKTTDSDFSPGGYKFTLETENNITVSNSNNKTLYKIISGTNTEFKIKETIPASGGAKILTLEKALDISKLAEKIKLSECTNPPNTTNNECTLPGEINVSNGDNDNTVGATISGTSPKIKFLQEQPNHNQGFKFNTLSDIALSGGNPAADNKKIESKGTYEIKKIEEKWYLAKVTPK